MNTLLSVTLMSDAVIRITGDKRAGVHRIEESGKLLGYGAIWNIRGEQCAANFPVEWALDSQNGFESKFSMQYFPHPDTKPDCACSWEKKGDQWQVASMCGAHHDFIRKYCR